jgi:hypothetical protein
MKINNYSKGVPAAGLMKINNYSKRVPAATCNLKYILFLAYVSPLKNYHCNLQGTTLVCIKIY